jgi:molybdate transport system substrate-binding protein
VLKFHHFASRIAVLALLLTTPLTRADQVTAAVAANFTAAMKKLGPAFERQTGHRLVASFGATGALYAQISNGAPFDVFLSADDKTPQRLIKDGGAVAGSDFIYARGRLALWSATPGFVDAEGAILKTEKFTRIAIANPQAAPYGQAAVDALTKLGLLDALQPKFVTGESIAQAQQFVSSGNVPLGFIALGQVMALPKSERGSWWLVPDTLHQPIDQGAVLLARAKSPRASRAFLDFLKSPEAVKIIRDFGYDVP